jgi:hypothetical protein
MPTSIDYRGWSGQSHGWRYLAQKIDGTGTPGVFIDNELPLHSVKLSDVLSGPPQLSGVIDPVYLRDRAADGNPLFGEWSTAIYAEADGQIRGGALLVGSDFDGPQWILDGSGFSGALKGIPYPGSVSFIETDAIDIVRHIWGVAQSAPDGNLGMIMDTSTRSGVLIGAQPTVVTQDASTSSTSISSTGGTDDGPFLLNWWTNTDLGGDIDKIAASAGFDYHERHVWNSTQTDVLHYLDFGYPTIGIRRPNLRFVLGENIFTPPRASRNFQDFCNEVQVLGAGEGSAMIRGSARTKDGRVRRVATISDKSITSVDHAHFVARLELARRNQILQLSEVAIRNTGMAPIGSFMVGDEIRVQSATEWNPIDMWCRITQLDVEPDNPDMQVASLMRTDWLL